MHLKGDLRKVIDFQSKKAKEKSRTSLLDQGGNRRKELTTILLVLGF